MFSITAFAVSVILINLSACGNGTIESEDIKQKSIYRTYTATYDLDQEEMSGYARFAAGGPLETSVALTEPSMVMMNATRLDMNDGRKRAINWTGTFYTHDFNRADLPATAEFVWYGEGMKKTEDVAVFPRVFFFQNLEKGSVISRAEDLNIKLNSTRLEADETYEVSIRSKNTDEKSEEEDCCHYQTFTVRDDLRVKASDLAELPTGPAELKLTRVRSQDLPKTETDGGGRVRAKLFRSIEIQIAD